LKDDFLTILKFNLVEQLGLKRINEQKESFYMEILEENNGYLRIDIINGDGLKNFEKNELKNILFDDNEIAKKLKIIIFDEFVNEDLDIFSGMNYLLIDLSQNKIIKRKIFNNIFNNIVFSVENILFEDLKNKIDEFNPDKKTGDYNPKIVYIIKNPFYTYFIASVNVIIFLILNIYSYIFKLEYNISLIFFAKVNDFILDGEYWRFITPIFLHSDIKHLFFNTISLIFLGSIVERLLGHKKFLIIYFIAGIYGNLFSFSFSNNNSVGASGAIFGLMGVLIFYGISNEDFFKTSLGSNILLLLFFNIFYGLLNTRIDNYAHMGGLVSGYLVMGVLTGRKNDFYLTKEFNLYVFITVTIICLVEGFF
jgi:rhomboid protease GluP